MRIRCCVGIACTDERVNGITIGSTLLLNSLDDRDNNNEEENDNTNADDDAHLTKDELS